jgi:hypothetical protein
LGEDFRGIQKYELGCLNPAECIEYLHLKRKVRERDQNYIMMTLQEIILLLSKKMSGKERTYAINNKFRNS